MPLFADGAAAVVLGEGSNAEQDIDHWNLRDTASILVPDSLDAMTWHFEMTLSPRLPQILRRSLRPWCEAWLARHERQLGDIASWSVHPGGPKILSAVADALGLAPEALDACRATLAQHGNMSSATILFILEQMDQTPAAGPRVAIGLGPGLVAEGMLLGRKDLEMRCHGKSSRAGRSCLALVDRLIFLAVSVPWMGRPGLWARRVRQRRRRCRLALCPRCVYDLRATPDPSGPTLPRCPRFSENPKSVRGYADPAD